MRKDHSGEEKWPPKCWDFSLSHFINWLIEVHLFLFIWIGGWGERRRESSHHLVHFPRVSTANIGPRDQIQKPRMQPWSYTRVGLTWVTICCLLGYTIRGNWIANVAGTGTQRLWGRTKACQVVTSLWGQLPTLQGRDSKHQDNPLLFFFIISPRCLFTDVWNSFTCWL